MGSYGKTITDETACYTGSIACGSLPQNSLRKTCHLFSFWLTKEHRDPELFRTVQYSMFCLEKLVLFHFQILQYKVTIECL